MSDEDLISAGLVPVRAFVRTATSRNAQRVRKRREKAAASGIMQVNVMAPSVAHPIIKAIAKETQAGRSVRAALESLLLLEANTEAESAAAIVPRSRLTALEQLARKVTRLKGWRWVLARILGLV
jgi:hypothetical protein